MTRRLSIAVPSVHLPRAPSRPLTFATHDRRLAAPEAHILRIDPRAGVNGGKPVLTTVLEVVQFKRTVRRAAPCSGVTGAGTLSCWSEQLEKPGALWDPFPFPEANAHLLCQGRRRGHAHDVRRQDAVGQGAERGRTWARRGSSRSTASSGMGYRFGDARAIAHELIERCSPTT